MTLIHFQAKAQTEWQYTAPGDICEPNPGFTWWLGRVGIRTQIPAKPLHIYSTQCITGDPQIYPAVARLQTFAENYGFGQSSIQYWSGLQGNQDWQVSSIKAITNAKPVAMPPLVFNTNNINSPADWLGGLAFYCSSPGQQPQGDGAEVMRLYDQRVAINSPEAKGRLDISTNPTGSIKPRFIFDNVGGSDPVLKMYRPSGAGTLGEFPESYPLWMQYETAAPFALGYAQFHIKGRDWAVEALGNEVQGEMRPRLTVLTGIRGNVGINQTLPDARLEVGGGSVLFQGYPTDAAQGSGNTPKKWTYWPISATEGTWTASELGNGTRFMWIPNKKAFRGGEINSSQFVYQPPAYEGGAEEEFGDLYGESLAVPIEKYWDESTIGLHSLAYGVNVRSSGDLDISMGLNNVSDSRYALTSPSFLFQHCSMTFGQDNLSTGSNNVAMGWRNQVIGGMAYGDHNFVNGGCYQSVSHEYNGGIAIGSYNNIGSFTENSNAPATLETSYGSYIFGRNCYLTSAGSESMLIGVGKSPYSSDRLKMDFPNSLGIGFNATTPTVYVGPASSEDVYGKVGIGTISPVNRLDVNGSVSIGYGATPPSGTGVIPSPSNSLFVQASIGIGTNIPKNSLDVKTSASFGFKDDFNPALLDDNVSISTYHRVGIETSDPVCTLGVNGTACIGWGGDMAVPASPTGYNGVGVGMIVEHAVIIGGDNASTYGPTYMTAHIHETNPTDYVQANQALLQVWGDAVKMKANHDWDVPSDARYKKNIKSFTDGLELLKKINPITFRYDEKLGIKQDQDGIGILAQDMQKIAPYTVRENTLIKVVRTKEVHRYQVDEIDTLSVKTLDQEKIEAAKSDTSSSDEFRRKDSTLYKDSTIYRTRKRWVVEPAEFKNDSMPLLTYNPSALTYVIINSIKEIDSLRSLDKIELVDKILAQNNRIESQKSTIDSLVILKKNIEERLTRLETQNNISLNGVSDIILEQNNPNPFADKTTITYYIPDKVQGVPEIVVTPASSQSPVLQKYPLLKGTPTQLTISAQDLYTGVFVYSITVNGTVLASKKFIIIK